MNAIEDVVTGFSKYQDMQLLPSPGATQVVRLGQLASLKASAPGLGYRGITKMSFCTSSASSSLSRGRGYQGLVQEVLGDAEALGEELERGGVGLVLRQGQVPSHQLHDGLSPAFRTDVQQDVHRPLP